MLDIKGEEGVSDAFYKTKEKAMEEFKEKMGRECFYLLDSLEDNPLKTPWLS